MVDEGAYPVLNGGIDFSGYTHDYNEEADTIAISQGGASAGYVNWVDRLFWEEHIVMLLSQTKTF